MRRYLSSLSSTILAIGVRLGLSFSFSVLGRFSPKRKGQRLELGVAVHRRVGASLPKERQSSLRGRGWKGISYWTDAQRKISLFRDEVLSLVVSSQGFWQGQLVRVMGPRFKGSKSSSKRWAYIEKYGRLLVAIAQSGSERGVLAPSVGLV
ncbi:hypothetical protein GOBAR_AA33237 [Gossypium barbadense]|uniref:Uncharacterized protein n=1 Tax=Gossypium barbadense TaxID=3634 RepID=A0A2P5W8N5_GOSBA|nr:hypothetical protein GOBAR_AA33237 [Gossypium barbadense]